MGSPCPSGIRYSLEAGAYIVITFDGVRSSTQIRNVMQQYNVVAMCCVFLLS